MDQEVILNMLITHKNKLMKINKLIKNTNLNQNDIAKEVNKKT